MFYSSEVESRTQGSRPRPRTQKKSEAKAKDSLSEDRHSRGQGPRTQAQVLSKKSSQKFFKRSPQKNVFQIIFQALLRILTIQKIVLSSSRGQHCPRAEDRPIFEDLRPRDQGQGLQNVFLKTSSRPRTFSRTPPPLFISKMCYFGLIVVHCVLISCGVVIPMRAIDVFECLTMIPSVVFMIFLVIAVSINIK